MLGNSPHALSTTTTNSKKPDAKELSKFREKEVEWWESILHYAPGTLKKLTPLTSPALLRDHKLTHGSVLMVEPFTFTWVLASLAAGAIAWVGGKIMDNVFGNRNDQIFDILTHAIEKIIDKRFTEHEIADLGTFISNITGNLRVFNNTPNQARIDEAITQTINAESYISNFFKEEREVLVYRYKVVLGMLTLQAHQTQMKYWYDEGVRTNQNDLIVRSYGEINNILKVISTYATGYLSQCWVSWNAKRFSELFKIPFVSNWYYGFEGNGIDTGTSNKDEAIRVLENHKEKEFFKLRDEHIVPVVNEFIFPLIRQKIFLETLSQVFNEIKKRPPNYYEIKEYAELIDVNSRSLYGNDWDQAEKLMRDKLNATLTHTLDEKLIARHPVTVIGTAANSLISSAPRITAAASASIALEEDSTEITAVLPLHKLQREITASTKIIDAGLILLVFNYLGFGNTVSNTTVPASITLSTEIEPKDIVLDEEQIERHVIFSLCLMKITVAYWNGNKYGTEHTYPLNPSSQEISSINPLNLGKGSYLGHNIASFAVTKGGKILDFDFNHNEVFNSSIEHAESRLMRRVFSLTQAYTSWNAPDDKSENEKPLKYGNMLKEATVYTTLESCTQCTGVMNLGNVESVVYLQTDPGMNKIGNLVWNLTKGQNEQKGPKPIEARRFRFFYQEQLDKEYDVFKRAQKDSKGEPLVVPATGSTGIKSYSDSITSFLCTKKAFSIFAAAATDFDEYQVVSEKNKAILTEAKDFAEYAISRGNRATPHK